MAASEEEAAEARLFRMVIGNRVTQALYVVTRLGIADRLADGPKDAAALARETGVLEDPLYRVLRGLVAVEVLALDASHRFSLTPMGRLLRSDAGRSLAASARFNGEENYRAWGDLLHAVKTGETPFDHVFGMRHFEYLARNPDASATFNAAMAASFQVAGDPLRGYPFTGHRVVVDVGGGHGALIATILGENVGLRGIVYDLPAAVTEAPAYLASKGVASRCEVRTGSAFEIIPSGGDVYIMSRLLHDFPDERAEILLRNCRTAMPSGGVLLIREGVLPEGPVPANRAFLDLEMMVMNGGRERTEAEWRALLGRCGLSLRGVRSGARNQDLLEATPVDSAPGAAGGRRQGFEPARG